MPKKEALTKRAPASDGDAFQRWCDSHGSLVAACEALDMNYDVVRKWYYRKRAPMHLEIIARVEEVTGLSARQLYESTWKPGNYVRTVCAFDRSQAPKDPDKRSGARTKLKITRL